MQRKMFRPKGEEVIGKTCIKKNFIKFIRYSFVVLPEGCLPISQFLPRKTIVS
jgi:hypothetical protein